MKNPKQMKKENLLMVVAGIALATAVAPTNVVAQELAGDYISTTTTLPITEVTQLTDGSYNFKSFEVEASESGEYFTEFWLLPAKYSNNRYTTFLVYVNGKYVGAINPSTGNWQSARVDGNKRIGLAEGKNVITVATPAPEWPAVETLKVALNDSDAAFSSEAYEEYLEGAAAGVTYDIPEEDGLSMYASDAASAGMEHFTNVPLNYTFFNTFRFTKGQEIFITTNSAAAHKIDIVYYGTTPQLPYPPVIPPYVPFPNPGPIVNPGPTANPTTGSISGTDVPAVPNATMPWQLYYHATSEEMQGLSWVFPSEKALNASTQVATARVPIPKTGDYLIRVRHAENGGSSLADLNVNGAYFYEDIPISLSYEKCVIPADDYKYATMTCSYNFNTDDPYLFIHGANCDKIVGYNDDGPKSKIQQYELATHDSYISQKYKMKTSGISVSNYSSSKPQSRCNIIARLYEGDAPSVAQARAKSVNTAGVSETAINEEPVQITGPYNINGALSISANEKIQKVSVYGLAGNCIGSVKDMESCCNIPASSLNITQPGIYIVSVETTNGITSKKFAVR